MYAGAGDTIGSQLQNNAANGSNRSLAWVDRADLIGGIEAWHVADGGTVPS